MQSCDEESGVEVDCQALFTLGQHQLWISALQPICHFYQQHPTLCYTPTLLTLPGQEIAHCRSGHRRPPSRPLVMRIEPSRV